MQVNLHQLLVRALDLDLDNRPERVQAVKLARRILVFGRWAVAGVLAASSKASDGCPAPRHALP